MNIIRIEWKLIYDILGAKFKRLSAYIIVVSRVWMKTSNY